MSKSARTHRTYLPIALLLLAGLQAPAQNILGKHPADKVLPQFFNQNDNANTIIDGLNLYGTHPLNGSGGTINAAQIGSGVLDINRIPDLDAGKIVSGTLAPDRIPGLPGTRITSGTLPVSVIPSLPANQVASGVLDPGRIPSLDASVIGSGTFDPARIPGLSASKITSGTFDGSMISGGSAHPDSLSTANLSVSGSVAEGLSTLAGGAHSHAEGTASEARGADSHAEGENTLAASPAAHAEGNHSTASGGDSHAEGINTTASGLYSHAEGAYSHATGEASHAEGSSTASGDLSHSEGSSTQATSDDSHAEGQSTTASGIASHAEGSGTIASGNYSHAAGANSTAGHALAWVWSDGTTFGSTMDHQFSAYAANGFRFLGGGITGVGSGLTGIPASAIASGQFGLGLLPTLDLAHIPALDLAHLPTLDAAHIPNLDAGKLTTGTLGTGLIPSLDASKITSGNLNAARIPLLDASKIASGTFGSAQIPSLDASKINSGTFSAARIPTLPASQVTAPGGSGSDGALLFNDGGALDGDHSHLYVGHSGGTVNAFAFVGGANLDPDNPNRNYFVFQDSYDPGYPVWNLDVGSGGVFQVGSSINYGRYNPPTFRMGGDGIGLWDQAQAFVMDNYSLTFNTDNSFMVNANSSYFQFICDMQNGHVTLYDMDLNSSGDITTQGMIRLGSSGAGVASGCGDPTQDGPYPCSAGTLYLGANATVWLYTGSEWRQVF